MPRRPGRRTRDHGGSAWLAGWVPGYRVLLAYRLPWLRRDLPAGLSLAAVMVPAGMAYAVAAGLPAITGLYATVVPLVAYALFGPSRILVVGPDSALVPLIASTVLPLAGGQQGRALVLATARRSGEHPCGREPDAGRPQAGDGLDGRHPALTRPAGRP